MYSISIYVSMYKDPIIKIKQSGVKLVSVCIPRISKANRLCILHDLFSHPANSGLKVIFINCLQLPSLFDWSVISLHYLKEAEVPDNNVFFPKGCGECNVRPDCWLCSESTPPIGLKCPGHAIAGNDGEFVQCCPIHLPRQIRCGASYEAWHIAAVTKSVPYCKQHFHMHLRVWMLFYFWNSTPVLNIWYLPFFRSSLLNILQSSMSQ